MLRHLCFIVCMAIATGALGQITPPSEYLGYELGEQFSYAYQVEGYFKQVADESDHLSMAYYGSSYEGRPLFVTYISSPGNLARLDAIQKSNLTKAGLTDGKPLENQPVIIWLSYNIHGNEAVSTETAMETAYELISKADSTYSNWLDSAIVIIDPCLNPDGHTRYVQFYRERLGFKPNPHDFTREHMEPWPGGRANHYLFDLNRDWAWLTQKESQDRIQLLNKWLPHVHVDFHEMGINSPYYFAPSAEPIHENITDWQRTFQNMVGDHLSAVFDSKKWLYFTGEVFDLFYPSYGDTYPSFNGAIGMTYEQGGSGRAGLAVINSKGDTLTLSDRIQHHHIAGIHTIELAVMNRQKLVDQFEQYFQKSIANPIGKYKAYIIKNTNEQRIKHLSEFLNQHQIQYGYGSKTNSVNNAYNYVFQKTETATIADNDLVISALQPKSHLLKTLFEPQTHLPDSNTYDITAWSIPYAWGLEAWASPTAIEPATSSLQPVKTEPIIDTKFAYALLWKDKTDAIFLSDCLQKGIDVKVNKKIMVYDDINLPAGTLLFPPSAQKPDDFDTLKALADRHGKTLINIPSGYPGEGPAWGSAHVIDIDLPSIAILSGKGTNPYSVGTYWHFMEMELSLPVNIIEHDDLKPAILENIDVVLLPSGYRSDYLNDQKVDMIKNWAKSGGTIIAIENAVSQLEETEKFGIKKKDKPETDDGDESDTLAIDQYTDRYKDYISYQNPGVILKVKMDNSHPLGYGYPDHFYNIKTNTSLYKVLENGWNIGVCTDEPVVSGFVGHLLKSQMNNFMVFGEESVGRGKLIYLTDDPIFRSFWEGGKLLVSNAIFFSKVSN